MSDNRPPRDYVIDCLEEASTALKINKVVEAQHQISLALEELKDNALWDVWEPYL